MCKIFEYQCEIHFTGECIDINKRLKSDEAVMRMLLSVRGGAELELRDFTRFEANDPGVLYSFWCVCPPHAWLTELVGVCGDVKAYCVDRIGFTVFRSLLGSS
jgi:hypothetical protein